MNSKKQKITQEKLSKMSNDEFISFLKSLMLDNKQVWQFPNKSELNGSDLFLINDSQNSDQAKNTTVDQVVEYVDSNAQLGNSGQVTGLDSQLSTLTSNLSEHVGDTGNPHDTSLQQAYDENNVMVLDENPLVINDMNDIQQSAFSTKGSQIHLPIYHIASSQTITLSGGDIDTIYSNDESATANSIIIQQETFALYADNATFYFWSNGTQALSVTAQDGVSLNSVNGNTVTAASNALLKVSRIAANEWETNVISYAAGSGVTIGVDGTISLTGTGASAAYSYISGMASTYALAPIAFSDNAHYFIPFANITPMVSRGNNLAPYYDGYSHLGIKNIGTETGVFNIILNCQFAYGSSNTNSASNNYVISGNINTAAGPDGSFAPIDLISTPYSSGSDKPFTVMPNYTTNVVFPVQIQLAPGDVFYPVVRNVGPSNDPTKNAIYMPSFSYTTLKAGDTGGTSAGVSSLAGLTGNINLESSDGSFIFTPAGSNLDVTLSDSVSLKSSNWTPTLTVISGISGAITLNSARYLKIGFFILCTLDITLTANDSAISFAVSSPVTPNFTDDKKVTFMGGVLTSSSPNAADGNILNAQSDPVNQCITITANSSLGSGTKYLRLSFMEEIA